LTVDLIQTPLPTVDVVTLANKRAQDPDEDDTNTPHPPTSRPDPPPTAQAGPSAAALQLTGQLNLIRPHLDLPPLAPEPIMAPHATITLELLGWWPQPTHGAAVELRRFALTLPSRHDPTQSATLRARWAARRLLDPRGRPPQLELDVWLEDSDCATAVGAIPKGMLPNLHDQLQVEGRFAPHLEFSVDMDDLYTVELEVTGLPGSCRITELGRYDPSYLAGNFKQEVREGVTRKGIFVGPDSGRYVPLFAMPHHLRLATYMTEEPRFYRNPGFDLKRTAGAIRLNLKHGRYVYGGSTLTQQLVKNLFLTRQKTLSRKLEEAFIVWKVEEILPKRRILELYLNCIEFGPNLYGIGRASWFYFGKPPSRLSVLESAFLAGIKPQPRMGIGPRARGHTSPDGFWPERLKRILGRMTRAGLRGASLPQEPYVVYFKTWKRRRR
ncbi:MAG: biosynthetic peptidoglycan transglycosylase, partial [Myxococcota bacterium]